MLSSECIKMHCTISDMLAVGSHIQKHFQDKDSCEMGAYFWLWLVLSLTVVIIFCSKVAGILKIVLCYFIINGKTVRNS